VGHAASASECYHHLIVQIAIAIVASFLSGGLAGSCLTTLYHRSSRRRELRTKFHPGLNSMWAAYLIRMERPDGRYLINVVGYVPEVKDREFVDHRDCFLSELVQYNELKEACVLLRQMLDNLASGNHNHGEARKLDLAPDFAALQSCLTTVQKKLKIS
jgi:hypothetical protein